MVKGNGEEMKKYDNVLFSSSFAQITYFLNRIESTWASRWNSQGSAVLNLFKLLTCDRGTGLFQYFLPLLVSSPAWDSVIMVPAITY